MDSYIKECIVVNTIWSYVLIIWIFVGENSMTFLQSIVISLIPATITGIVTFVTVKNSQLKENTNTLVKLIEQLGLTGEETLQNQLGSKFRIISNDIGRNDDASLTKQHKDIVSSIEKSFEKIQKRYDREDANYRNFNSQQYELKKVLDNFAKDYEEQIRKVNELQNSNAQLLQKISELESELSRYRVEEQEI